MTAIFSYIANMTEYYDACENLQEVTELAVKSMVDSNRHNK